MYSTKYAVKKKKKKNKEYLTRTEKPQILENSRATVVQRQKSWGFSQAFLKASERLGQKWIGFCLEGLERDTGDARARLESDWGGYKQRQQQEMCNATHLKTLLTQTIMGIV